MNIDFKSLNEFLKPRVLEILTELLPGGRLNGREYQCGNSAGGPGDSLRYNVDKLTGSDFAAGENFGDLIDLYGKIHGVSMGDAAKQLAEKYGFSSEKPPSYGTPPSEIAQPGATSWQHYKYGAPSAVWHYNDTFCMARYDPPTGKQFAPWTLVDGQWRMKAPPKPRPLYNLAEINAGRDKPVLVVEGEKAAEAAKLIAGQAYVVTTWPNGAAAVQAADWQALKGRHVTVWPDADAPGRKAAQEIAVKLSPLCPEIKILNVDDHDNGWDAADANFEWEDFDAWAAKRTTVYMAVAVTPQAVAVAGVQLNIALGDEDILDDGHIRLWEELGIACTKSSGPICNADNVLRVLEGSSQFKDMFWYDDFYHEVFWLKNGKAKIWEEIDGKNLMIFIQRKLGFRRVTESMIRDAVLVTANMIHKNEPKDYMDSVLWDGVERVEEFFINAAGSPDTDYVRAVSRNFWISLAARVFTPGCKVDTMVILEGRQGTRKSTLLEIIAGKWHSSVINSMSSIDFYQCLRGKILLEFADLSGFDRADRNHLKQMLSNRTDNYRRSYGHNSGDYPRQSIFSATTNEKVYLQDETGARRFWPVETTSISIDYAREFRDQLFAEAVNLFKSNAFWWEMPESTEEEQESRRETHPWETKIHEYIKNREEVTIDDILTSPGPIPIEIGKRKIFDEMKVGNILRMFGWIRVRRRISGVRIYVFYPSDKVQFLPKNEAGPGRARQGQVGPANENLW